MKIFYALVPEELERYYAFRDMESRVRTELSVELINKIKTEAATMYTTGEAKPYEVKDGTASIRIEGTLEPKRTISGSLYGETTTYGEIEEATISACNDISVQSIDYHINSPGGNWDGVDHCAEIIKTASKPTRAIVYTGAHSGGYYLASQADSIYAATKGSSVGSIGVAAEYFDRTMEDNKKGIKRLVFTNKESTDKRPDITTDSGAEVIQENLQNLYKIFEDRVIEGRVKNVALFTEQSIRQLKGRSVTAERALEIGLIDGILSEMPAKNIPAKLNSKEIYMTLSEFLESNVDAKAEYTAAINKSASEKTTAALKEEQTRILEIMTCSGVLVSDEAKSAVEKNISADAYAKIQLIAMRKTMNMANDTFLGKPNADISYPTPPGNGGNCGGGYGGSGGGNEVTESTLKEIARSLK